MTTASDRPARRTRYPEWLVGGPWNGDDKVTRLGPGDSSRGVVAQVAVDLHAPPGPGELYEHRGPKIARIVYERKPFAIGETVLTVWVAKGVGDLEAATLLAEILLAPHRIPAAG